MHLKWLLSLFWLNPSVLCHPDPGRNYVVKQLVIPIDLYNGVQLNPNQLISQGQRPQVFLEYKPTRFVYPQSVLNSPVGTSMVQTRPENSLEHQPTKPSDQVVPPISSSSEDYRNCSQNFEEATVDESTITELAQEEVFATSVPVQNTTSDIAQEKNYTSLDSHSSTIESTRQTESLNEISTVLPKEQVNSLGYKPTRPFYHPNPGNNIAQIVPPGKPWPSRPEDYQNFTQTLPNLVDRLKETSTQEPSTETTPSKMIQEQTVILEYNPTRPSFHPNPGNNIAQIVPPGKPWPSRPEDYQNFTQAAPNLADRLKETSTQEPSTESTPSKIAQEHTISLEYNPILPSFHPNPGNNIAQIVPPGKPWPSRPEDYQNFSQTAPPLAERAGNSSNEMPTENSTATTVPQTQTPISLEYKPMKPFYWPSGGIQVGQIVPPGKPWPSRPENTSQTVPPLADRFKDNTSTESSTDATAPQTQTSISLEYKPMQPGHWPSGGIGVGQIVPPGKPWPASAENVTQPPPSLVDRIKETSSQKPSTTSGPQLEYAPTRPFYHPKPGDYVTQIVPPGKPWPARPEDYQNFTGPEATSSNPAQLGFEWESARKTEAGAMLYTSNPDAEESSPATTSAEASPLFTSAPVERSTNPPPQNTTLAVILSEINV